MSARNHQVSIRKSPHIQRPALNGAKNSSRLGKFFESSVCQADTNPEPSECKCKPAHSKTKWSFKRRRELFHTDITQHFPTGFSMAVRGRREGFGASHTDNIRQEASQQEQQRLFSKVLRLKTRIPSRQSTQPMMCPSWAQKERDENNSSL